MNSDKESYVQFSGTEQVTYTIVHPIKVKKIHKDAVIPDYETSGSAGFDLTSVANAIIDPGTQKLIPTGLTFELPIGTELQIRPRSGLALKKMITVTNSPGTVDSDYRGEIKVILLNLSKVPFFVKVGDRIAQGVLASYLNARFEEVDKLSDTVRGTGGYGHTGI